MQLDNPDALPLKTPLVMMNLHGSTLKISSNRVPYVEFHSAEVGLVTIRSAEDTCLHLTRPPGILFGPPQAALKFEKKVSPAGRIVFVEKSTGNALEIDINRRVCCHQPFYNENQSWLLLQPHQLCTKPCTNFQLLDLLCAAAALEAESAGRRSLIMHLVDAGKSSKELKEILELLYGSTSLINDKAKSDAEGVERRQYILKLLINGKSTMEVGELLTLMYGTVAPLSNAVKMELSDAK